MGGPTRQGIDASGSAGFAFLYDEQVGQRSRHCLAIVLTNILPVFTFLDSSHLGGRNPELLGDHFGSAFAGPYQLLDNLNFTRIQLVMFCGLRLPFVNDGRVSLVVSG